MTRRFRFRLETLLATRRRHERRKQHELAAALDALARSRIRHRAIDGRVERLLEDVGRWNQSADGSVPQLVWLRDDLARRRSRRHELDGEIRWLEESVGRLRGELERATRERLAVERLRSRRLEEHRLRERRMEERALEDHTQRVVAELKS